jgi:hypothetical protein
MPGINPGTDARVPALRVLPYEGGGPITLSDRRAARAREERPSLRLVDERSPILVAGSDTPRRAALLDDLTETLPEGTCFEEVSTLGEVLERAPASRMVILNDALDDVSAAALMRILSLRHPRLPVITLDPAAPDGL